MTLKKTQNPLLAAKLEAVDLAGIMAPVVNVRGKRDVKRELRRLKRTQSAKDAIAGLTTDNEIYGFTKGQFSLLELLAAVVEMIGPLHLQFSTWTASRQEITALDQIRQAGNLLSTRWLLDHSFSRRDPEAAHAIREMFGMESMRVAHCHAKFALFKNDGWQLVLRTSMNLNMNPRFEDFTLSHDPELFAFITAIMDEIWTKQRKGMDIDTPRGEFGTYFRDEM